jgi:polyisoprenoid-binding protein YceI
MECQGSRGVNMKKRFLFQFLLSTVLLVPVYALELQNPLVVFEALGKPSFLKIKGETKHLRHEQKQEASSVVDSFTVDLSTLDTGIELRDEHMKEKYLKTKENPLATLVFLKEGKSVLDFQGEKEITGTLTLNGKAKELTVKAKREKNNIQATLELKLTDFSLEIPSWSGISVADLVKIKTSFDLPLEVPALTR